MTKALIIVDMVKGFLEEETKDGPCALHIKGARGIIPNINREMAALGKDDLIIFVSDWHKENDAEFERWPKHCIANTEESALADGFHIPESARLQTIHKTRFSGFHLTILGVSLPHPKNVDELIIAGVCTDICVFATALDACYRGYKVTIPKDCVFPLYHMRGEVLLRYLVDMFGITVR